MEKQIIISYNWYNSEDNNKEISTEHQEILENSAIDRINEMRSDGYTSGELIEDLDGINYQGWFTVTSKTI